MKRTSEREQGHRAKENERKRKTEALNLSPARIEDGATTTTKVLSTILGNAQKNYYLRDWGINE